MNKIFDYIKFKKKLYRCKNTCIFGSVYSLLLYILQCPDDELEKTFYMCYAPEIDYITKKLPFCDTCYELWWDRVDKYKLWRYRLKSLTKYFAVRFTKIYAQADALGATQLIGHRDYIVIEDGHGYFTYGLQQKRLQPFVVPRTLWGWKQKIKYGPLYGKKMGTNSQCVDRLITADFDADSSWIKGRKYTLLNLEELWRSASDYKKRFIYDVYDINDDMLGEVRKCHTIVLTQPWAEAYLIPEHEVAAIYAPYIEKYKDTGVVIKPHPREKLDYRKYFPDVYIWETRAPLQLFMLMGLCFDNAVTVNSSAVSLFTKSTNIIWLGTEVHPTICKRGGHSNIEDFIRR